MPIIMGCCCPSMAPVLLGVLLTAADNCAMAAESVGFASMFTGDSVVLQKEVPVAVWGNISAASIKAGTKVMLSLDDANVATATVDWTSMQWSAILPPQQKSWGRKLSAIIANDHGILGRDETRVKFGHVLLCSGQSNMGMPVNNWKAGGFCAENGTAESNAAGTYTGKISLLTAQQPFPRPTMPPWNGSICNPRNTPQCTPEPVWNAVSPGANGTLHGFSAVCWYTGKSMFESLHGQIPVGLMAGAVGGSPIESWLPPSPGAQNNTACGLDSPPCDINHNISDSGFFNMFIRPLMPYTIGTVVWDQGERDVRCFAPASNHTARYPCLERELVRSWREGFKSTFAFATVQLPGYIGDCDSTNASPNASYTNCVPGVFNMRIAQDVGTDGNVFTTVTPTYDLSCPFGVKSPQCPFGSVHNIRKAPIGARIANQVLHLHGEVSSIAQGPRVLSVSVRETSTNESLVTVDFEGGTSPFYLAPTQFCGVCCDKNSNISQDVGDFDVSIDGGRTYVNGTMQRSSATSATSVFFTAPATTVTHVRYTANQGFPQCALYNHEGYPALPFVYQLPSPSTQ